MKLAIVGAGGHAKEVFSSLTKTPNFDFENFAGFFVDVDNYMLQLFGHPVLNINLLNPKEHKVHIAVGDINFRIKISKELQKKGFEFVSIVDPSSIIASNVLIGDGTFIAPSATINIDSKIGFCTIINTGSIVSHDANISDYINISPGVILCGSVSIGSGSYIGAGTIIREKVKVESNVTIGMGSVVSSDVENEGTYIIKGSNIRRLR
jgi:sugar O-acyltransferase (sialic acid O-acetyltransferase NeuD family)